MRITFVNNKKFAVYTAEDLKCPILILQGLNPNSEKGIITSIIKALVELILVQYYQSFDNTFFLTSISSL